MKRQKNKKKIKRLDYLTLKAVLEKYHMIFPFCIDGISIPVPNANIYHFKNVVP